MAHVLSFRISNNAHYAGQTLRIIYLQERIGASSNLRIFFLQKEGRGPLLSVIVVCY